MRSPRPFLFNVLAAILVISALIVYYLSFHAPWGAPFRTSAGPSLLLYTVPLGVVLVWLLERRTGPRSQPSSPVWLRLLLGGAAGLLLATALVVINALGLAEVRPIPATSLGSVPGLTGGMAQLRLEEGQIVRFPNAFCGVTNSKVRVLVGKGLFGLERLVGCEVPFSPPEPPKKPVPIAPPPLPSNPHPQ
jgi:hypothetical protein